MPQKRRKRKSTPNEKSDKKKIPYFLKGCCLGHPAFFVGILSNPGERAKMPFTLSYKSQIVTCPYESLFNFFFFCALPPSSVSCLRDCAIRGSVVAAAVTVLCCCCFFLLLLLRGKLSFFFCCCYFFVVVTACSPY